MPLQPQQHLSPDELAAFLAGRLQGHDLSRAQRHISTCSHCCQLLEQLPEDAVAHRLRQFWKSRTPFVDSIVSSIEFGDDAQEHDPGELPPELLDHPRYRIVRLIGVGGMGRVYEAEHRFMERPVAIKIIHQRLLNHPLAAQRFQIEAKAAAKLDHPNIVHAYDAEQAGGLHYLVMEYVEGASLASIVQSRGALPLSKACSCIRQAAMGLQHAAEHGMVHRDIKPENLMLTRKGQVKILDFGLARLARETQPLLVSQEPVSKLRTAKNVTAVGAVLGTPQYIAPEQARDSGEVDIRADIYSLGCTLYFLLTGQTPGGVSITGASSLSAPPRVSSRPLPTNGLPPVVIPILQKMTDPDPARRYQTPREVVDALAPLARSSSKRRAPWLMPAALAAVILLGALLGIGIWKLFSQPAPRHESRRGDHDAATAARTMAATAPVPQLAQSRPIANASALAPAPRQPQAQSSAPKPATRSTLPPTTGQRTVLCILPPQFYWEDYDAVRTALDQSGIRMKVASTATCAAITGAGAPLQNLPSIQPDLLLGTDTVSASAYDALYLPGGYIYPYKDDTPARKAVWELLDDMIAAGKPVAALGHGQGILANKGALVNQTVAPNDKIRSWKPNYARSYSPDRVAVDGPFITARDSADAAELARRLITHLNPGSK